MEISITLETGFRFQWKGLAGMVEKLGRNMQLRIPDIFSTESGDGFTEVVNTAFQDY